jgi:LPS sulfotransferase NodH
MLEGIETGYEGKYDFPPRSAAPELAYLLASVPRTGSTWFSHLLWSSGSLGAPLEYLNFDEAGPYGFASRSPPQQQWLWRSVLRRRTSPNGVFGVKCFPSQLQQLQEGHPALLSDVMSTVLSCRPPRIVWLGRRDEVAHAVSYVRAILSGVWRKEQEADGDTRLEYSNIAIERARGLLNGQLAAWEEMFRDLRIEPLRLWYEDVTAAPEEAVKRVADYLGVELRPDAVVTVPAIKRQSEADSIEWASRYLAEGP